MSTQAMEGLLVIEVASGLQGPAAGGFLSDLGADVIKIEPPEGDPSRYHKGVNNYLPKETPGSQFIIAGRGKRSITLDIHTDLGKAVAYKLIEKADVFLSNYRESALIRMGLGYEELHRRNPKLVYAVASGFGPFGPDADRAMVDGAAQARGGIVSLTGAADGPPTLTGYLFADLAGAMQLALGIMTALVARGLHGTGQKVATSAYGSQLWMLMWEIAQSSISGHPLMRAGQHHGNMPGTYGIYQTSDDKDIFLAFSQTEESWQAFCKFGGIEEVGKDKRWNSVQKRMGMGSSEEGVIALEIRPFVRKAFKNRTEAEWVAFLDSEPSIIYNRIFDYNNVLNDPQAIANDYIIERTIPHTGKRMKVVGNPVSFSATPVVVPDTIPELGQHTEELMLEFGFDWDAITRLNEETEKALRRKFAAVTQEPPK